MCNCFPNWKYQSLYSSKQKHGWTYPSNTLVSVTNFCLSQCFISVKRHHDQRTSNRGRHLIGFRIHFRRLVCSSPGRKHLKVQTHMLTKAIYHEVLLQLGKDSKFPQSWKKIGWIFQGSYKEKNLLFSLELPLRWVWI